MYIKEMYGVEPGKESFANNCLLARKMVEKGVRFVQLYDWGWDSHGNGEAESLRKGFLKKCKDSDRPIAALILDLKQRGLLDETLVVWGGEFGRTPMWENRAGVQNTLVGRDHQGEALQCGWQEEDLRKVMFMVRLTKLVIEALRVGYLYMIFKLQFYIY